MASLGYLKNTNTMYVIYIQYCFLALHPDFSQLILFVSAYRKQA